MKTGVNKYGVQWLKTKKDEYTLIYHLDGDQVFKVFKGSLKELNKVTPIRMLKK